MQGFDEFKVNRNIIISLKLENFTYVYLSVKLLHFPAEFFLKIYESPKRRWRILSMDSMVLYVSWKS